jgi:hypothetical protein
VLAAILVVMAVVLYWQSARSDITPEEYSAAMSQHLQGDAGAPGAAPAAPQRRGGAPDRIPLVGLERLSAAQPEPADSGRDPFRFEATPAPGARSGPGAQPSVGPAQPAIQAAPAGPAGPPPIALKFIGVAKQGAGRLYAVLRDDRGVYYGAEGDVVEGRYRILRVSADTVELSYVDGRGRTSIPMSGGRP